MIVGQTSDDEVGRIVMWQPGGNSIDERQIGGDQGPGRYVSNPLTREITGVLQRSPSVSFIGLSRFSVLLP